MGKRHNLVLSDETWAILNELKRLKGISISAIIEETVKTYLKANKYNELYFKLHGISPFCDEKENNELTEILDNLSEEDMEISRMVEI